MRLKGKLVVVGALTISSFTLSAAMDTALAEAKTTGAPIAAQDAAASAGRVKPDGSWLGQCNSWVATYAAGGRCDGNGPNWRFRGWAECTDGGTYYGIERWAGDTRASVAFCPAGTSTVDGGVEHYYVVDA
jgi:hypothetical protein